MDIEHLKSIIRNVPDYPKPGIQFKDITPILQDPELFGNVIDIFYADTKVKKLMSLWVLKAGALFLPHLWH